MVELWYYAVPS